jgi:hypothetical protein
MGATLRADIYMGRAGEVMDRERTWWGGGTSSGTIMATIQKHFPGAKMGIENIGNAGNDVSSSGVTNSASACAMRAIMRN